MSTTPLQKLARSSSSSKHIRRGTDQYESIQALQSTLYALGFGTDLNWKKYGADGAYGSATTAAVRHFCQRNDLPGTGEEVTPTIAQKLLQRYEALDELQQLYGDLQAGRITQAYYQGSPHTIGV